MSWSDLKLWIFLRSSLSGAILGGLLGSPIIFPIGTVVGSIIGCALGSAVGAAKSITLVNMMRHLVHAYTNLRINKYIVTALFVSLNMLFTIICFGLPLAVGASVSLGDLITRMLTIGLIPALLSAIPAIYYTPSFVNKVTIMQAAINSRRLGLEHTQPE